MTEHVELHRDGSVRARGPMVDGVPEGHWEWFRLDGSRMRSGWFEHGEQVGEWTTYDRAGIAYTTTGDAAAGPGLTCQRPSGRPRADLPATERSPSGCRRLLLGAPGLCSVVTRPVARCRRWRARAARFR